MRERDRLAEVVQSLTEVLAATPSNPVLNQLIGIALLEASECLVRSGFEPAKLHELGLAEEMIYFIDAKYSPTPTGARAAGMPGRDRPYLRLVGS